MTDGLDLWLAFLAGLFSSVHCAGMCGPLVLAYASAGGVSQNTLGGLVPHLSYNSGRVLSYALLGAFLGLIGGSITPVRGAGEAFALLAGLGTVLFGVHALRRGALFQFAPAGGDDTSSGRILPSLLGFYRKTFGRLIMHPGAESKFYVGLLTPLLPCGLLYGMAMRSAGTPGALEGAAMMAAFGLGIVPVLVATGLAGNLLRGRLRDWSDRLAALTLILMGLVLVWRSAMSLFGDEHAGHMM